MSDPKDPELVELSRNYWVLTQQKKKMEEVEAFFPNNDQERLNEFCLRYHDVKTKLKAIEDRWDEIINLKKSLLPLL